MIEIQFDLRTAAGAPVDATCHFAVEDDTPTAEEFKTANGTGKFSVPDEAWVTLHLPPVVRDNAGAAFRLSPGLSPIVFKARKQGPHRIGRFDYRPAPAVDPGEVAEDVRAVTAAVQADDPAVPALPPLPPAVGSVRAEGGLLADTITAVLAAEVKNRAFADPAAADPPGQHLNAAVVALLNKAITQAAADPASPIRTAADPELKAAVSAGFLRQPILDLVGGLLGTTLLPNVLAGMTAATIPVLDTSAIPTSDPRLHWQKALREFVVASAVPVSVAMLGMLTQLLYDELPAPDPDRPAVDPNAPPPSPALKAALLDLVKAIAKLAPATKLTTTARLTESISEFMGERGPANPIRNSLDARITRVGRTGFSDPAGAAWGTQ